MANVQLEGGAGPPSLLGEEPEAEELLQAYETQKKVKHSQILLTWTIILAVSGQKLPLLIGRAFILCWHLHQLNPMTFLFLEFNSFNQHSFQLTPCQSQLSFNPFSNQVIQQLQASLSREREKATSVEKELRAEIEKVSHLKNGRSLIINIVVM